MGILAKKNKNPWPSDSGSYFMSRGQGVKIRRVFLGADLGRGGVHQAVCVFLLWALLCTSAVCFPGNEGCCPRQRAAFTLCCQMSSQDAERDAGMHTVLRTIYKTFSTL